MDSWLWSGRPDLRILTHEGFKWHDTINREFYESIMSGYHERGYMDFKVVNRARGVASP